MPDIPMPSRKAIPSGKGAADFIPATPMPSRRVGAETERLGKVLSGFGGTLGALSTKLQGLQYVSEMQKAETEDLKAYNEKLLELEQDDDYAGRGEKFATWYDSDVTARMNTIKSDRAKRDFKARSDRLAVTRKMQIELHARGLMVRNTQFEFKAWSDQKSIERATSSPEGQELVDQFMINRLEEMDENGMIQPGQVEVLFNEYVSEGEQIAYQNLVNSTFIRATEILDTLGEDEAVKFLLDRKDTGLDVKETKKLIYDIEFEAKRRKEETRRRSSQDRIDFYNETMEGILKRTVTPADIQADERISLSDKKTVTSAINAIMGKPNPDTDWKVYNDLIDKILSGEETRSNLQRDILDTRGNDLDISDAEMKSADALLNLKISPENRGKLKTGFDNIRRKSKATGGWWPLLSPLRESQEEAENTAKARVAFLSQIQERVSRKKETTLEDTYKISSEQAIAHRSGAASRAEILRIMPGLPDILKTQIRSSLDQGVSAAEILKADELQEYLKETK